MPRMKLQRSVVAVEERPLFHRLLAALALVALLWAGGVRSWWVLTDRLRAAPAETAEEAP